MKLVYLLLFLLAFEAISARRVRNRHHTRRFLAPKDNICYQFILGFVAALGGQEKLITECSAVVPGWEAAATKDTDDTEKQVGGESSSVFQTILKYLGIAIDAICNFKDKIIELLTKRFRRYIRLFLQGKVSGRFMRKGFFSGIWDKVVATGKEIVNGVVAGAKKVGNAVIKAGEWVGKKAEDVLKYVKEQIDKVLEPIYLEFDKLKAKFLAWLEKNPILQKVFLFAKCFITNDGAKAIKTLFNAVKSIVTLIPKLATPAGWIELAVNLICGWQALKEGIEFLLKGIKETQAPAKYYNYGSFFGKICEAIAG